MTLYNRLVDGTNLVAESFLLLWQRKSLIAYTAIPMALLFGLQLLTQLIFPAATAEKLEVLFDIDTLATRLLDSFSIVHYSAAFIINFLNITLLSFFYAALVYHVVHILQHKETTMRTTLQATYAKLRQIVEWSLISAVITMLLQLPSIAGASFSIILQGQASTSLSLLIPVAAILVIVSIAWSLLTLFVVPLIAVENINLLAAINLSIKLIRAAFIEVVGGIFWIGVVMVISSVIFAVLGVIINLVAHGAIKPALIWLISITMSSALFSLILSAVHTIFKAKILYLFHERAVDELQQIQHPPY